MATYYAWSPITSAESKADGKTVTVKPGETVTKDKLFLDDTGWDQLVESGAVRTLKYPDMPNGYQDSAVNFLRQQALKAEGAGEEEALAAETQVKVAEA